MKRVFLLLIFAFLASCSVNHIDSNETLSDKETAHLKKEGNATIGGQVLLFKTDSEIQFGKNTEVLLVPVCKASTDIITQVYGNTQNATRKMKDHPRFNWGSLTDFNKVTKTDKKGSFTFRKVPPGSYYILSFISLPSGRTNDGGTIMKRINVDYGQIKMVSMRL